MLSSFAAGNWIPTWVLMNQGVTGGNRLYMDSIYLAIQSTRVPLTWADLTDLVSNAWTLRASHMSAVQNI